MIFRTAMFDKRRALTLQAPTLHRVRRDVFWQHPSLKRAYTQAFSPLPVSSGDYHQKVIKAWVSLPPYLLPPVAPCLCPLP